MGRRSEKAPPDMTISPTATPEPTEVFPNKGTLSVLDESAQEVTCPGVEQGVKRPKTFFVIALFCGMGD